MSRLDPELDPEYVLAPERIAALEARAELPRARLLKLGPATVGVVRDWIVAELDVARRRAAEVGDFDFIECLATVERRLTQPGSYLREARISHKLKHLLETRRGPRLHVVEDSSEPVENR